MPTEREVAGLRCGQVLSHLSEYVDGELEGPQRSQIEAHLRGCDWCARFGGQFSALVARLRAELLEPEPVPEGVAARLMERLERA